jgi:hypothetical protein
MNTLFQRTILVLAAVTLLCAKPAAAQQPPAGYKDPGIATIISVLVPGGGQMYSGETKRGAMLLGIGLGGVMVGSALTIGSTSAAPALLGSLIYLGSWGYGIMDASDSANRMNAKRGLAVGGVQVQPSIAPGSEGGTRVGLELRF